MSIHDDMKSRDGEISESHRGRNQPAWRRMAVSRTRNNYGEKIHKRTHTHNVTMKS